MPAWPWPDKLERMMKSEAFSVTGGISRRHWSLGLLAGALGLGGLASAYAATNDLPKLTLLVNDTSTLNHLPVLLAEHLGFFKAEGLSVDILDQTSSVVTQETMASGGVYVWSAPYDLLFSPAAQGLGLMSIMQIGRTPQLALGVSRKTLPNFKRMQDLAGKRIGVMELDSQARRCVDYAMVVGGGSPASLIHVGMGSASHAMTALRNGAVDALCGPDPLMTLLEKKDDIDIVRNFRSDKDTRRLFAGPVPGNCLIAPQSLVKKHPQLCQGVVSGVARSLKWLRTAGPSDLLGNMLDNPILLDRAVYLSAVDNMRESFSLDGLMSNEAVQAALRLRNVLEPQHAEGRKSLQASFTNEFALKAQKRFKV
jgi:NitT/TauT family transport system substrate-binding protein